MTHNTQFLYFHCWTFFTYRNKIPHWPLSCFIVWPLSCFIVLIFIFDETTHTRKSHFVPLYQMRFLVLHFLQIKFPYDTCTHIHAISLAKTSFCFWWINYANKQKGLSGKNSRTCFLTGHSFKNLVLTAFQPVIAPWASHNHIYFGKKSIIKTIKHQIVGPEKYIEQV